MLRVKVAKPLFLINTFDKTLEFGVEFVRKLKIQHMSGLFKYYKLTVCDFLT